MPRKLNIICTTALIIDLMLIWFVFDPVGQINLNVTDNYPVGYITGFLLSDYLLKDAGGLAGFAFIQSMIFFTNIINPSILILYNLIVFHTIKRVYKYSFYKLIFTTIILSTVFLVFNILFIELISTRVIEGRKKLFVDKVSFKVNDCRITTKTSSDSSSIYFLSCNVNITNIPTIKDTVYSIDFNLKPKKQSLTNWVSIYDVFNRKVNDNFYQDFSTGTVKAKVEMIFYEKDFAKDYLIENAEIESIWIMEGKKNYVIPVNIKLKEYIKDY